MKLISRLLASIAIFATSSSLFAENPSAATARVYVIDSVNVAKHGKTITITATGRTRSGSWSNARLALRHVKPVNGVNTFYFIIDPPASTGPITAAVLTPVSVERVWKGASAGLKTIRVEGQTNHIEAAVGS